MGNAVSYSYTKDRERKLGKVTNYEQGLIEDNTIADEENMIIMKR